MFGEMLYSQVILLKFVCKLGINLFIKFFVDVYSLVDVCICMIQIKVVSEVEKEVCEVVEKKVVKLDVDGDDDL